MRHLLSIVLLICFLCPSVLFGENFNKLFKDKLKKANNGSAMAQHYIGSMYYKGDGISQDYKQAIYWFTKAAEQGQIGSQYILGALYFAGKEVPQDDKQAIYWFTEAAEQGHIESQYILGSMYYSGQGISQDFMKAYVWLSIAAAQGHEKAIKTRDIVRKKLTPQQVAEGREELLKIQ